MMKASGSGGRSTRRTWFTLVALLAAVGLSAGPVPAQVGGGGAPPPQAESLVRITAAPVALTAGGGAEALVTVEVAAGWHVNANPPSPDYMIPTAVAVAGAAGVSAGRVTYPAGDHVKLAFDENPLSVYTGRFTVKVALAAAPTAVNGTHALKGRLRFQSCNDQVCLAPVTVPFTVEATVSGGVAPGAAPPATAAPESAAASAAPETAMAAAPESAGATHGGGAPPATGTGDRLAEALRKGWLWWFVALFTGGLLLNLTPCVFPMLGVTVSVFGARRREKPAKVLAHAVVYVLGIAITYSVLGVVAALTGGLFGAALQNPWVNVGLGLLFIALSLSMFGLYEMQPPAWLLMRAGGADTTSLVGIFVSGLAVGIIAAPCVGPFVVAVLALIAQHGDALFGFQTMFVLSLGLGFPYLFLALFSNLLQTLPRSGDWMLWVKKVFGILIASIGLSYVLIGFAPRIAEWVPVAGLVLGGLYLGFVDRHGSALRGFRAFKWVFGALAVAGGVAYVFVLSAAGIKFLPYEEAAVQAALAGNQPVILEFSAAWCAPCHELDRYTFTDRRVIARSRAFAVYKVDLTRYDSPWSKGLRARYGVTGVPEILFFAPGGREVREARVIGFIPAALFLDRMEYALREGVAGR